ncbi:hypothetical protein RB195_018192 [Necator americanus]|uniref:Uncharacterized protein n=1 Tax=Necator americanus TaxID=51031 RepID=A0ABR1C8M8_NECAM
MPTRNLSTCHDLFEPFLWKMKEICLVRNRNVFAAKYTLILRYLRENEETFLHQRRSQQNYGLSLSSVVGGEAENVQDALYSSDGDEEMMEVAAEDEVENANRAHQRKEEQTKRRKPVLDIPDCAQDERGAFVVCLRMQPSNSTDNQICWIRCHNIGKTSIQL